ncbi:unnamed protein product [Citrullus colocynthis]|uniref:Uncharacterized protein n=1 Tax=Citrullus colocynthis TaxID=252529 RepID=A0ABP0YY21_9ROSI
MSNGIETECRNGFCKNLDLSRKKKNKFRNGFCKNFEAWQEEEEEIQEGLLQELWGLEGRRRRRYSGI